MKKRRRIIIRNLFLVQCVFFALFFVILPASAVLTNNGNGTITDDDRGNGAALMWLQEPGPDFNYDGAVAWADSLVFAGFDNWRLPRAEDFLSGFPDTGFNSVNNEFGNLYGVELDNPANLGDILPFQNYNPIWYWTETEDNLMDAYAFFWSFDGLWQNQSFPKAEVLHVTAVREFDGISSVPEPTTLLLIGTGLIGLAGFGRKKFFKK